MAAVDKSLEIHVPVGVAFDQWTQFEQFPLFMEGVEQVERVGDTRFRWVTDYLGRVEEWEALIHYMEPDERITWRASGDTPNTGSVHFDDLGPDRCRLTLHIDYQPKSVPPGLSLDEIRESVSRRVGRDLRRFREFIESRQQTTGSWRARIRDAEVQDRSERQREFAAAEPNLPDEAEAARARNEELLGPTSGPQQP